LVGPFAHSMDLGERENPSRDSNFRESVRFVEDLNDARTLLADFFSNLLSRLLSCRESNATG